MAVRFSRAMAGYGESSVLCAFTSMWLYGNECSRFRTRCRALEDGSCLAREASTRRLEESIGRLSRSQLGNRTVNESQDCMVERSNCCLSHLGIAWELMIQDLTSTTHTHMWHGWLDHGWVVTWLLGYIGTCPHIHILTTLTYDPHNHTHTHTLTHSHIKIYYKAARTSGWSASLWYAGREHGAVNVTTAHNDTAWPMYQLSPQSPTQYWQQYPYTQLTTTH